MLAYRHAFHAGNHADVLKHVVLMRVLEHLNAKPKPYRFVDTHAGAGGYSLEGAYARKKGEYEQGIGRLWARTDLPAPVADYVDLVRRFNPDGVLTQYPGSPALAQMLLRDQDQLRAFELHPTEQKILRAALAADRRATVLRQRRLRRPEVAAAAAEPPRRRADRPELRRQRRLRAAWSATLREAVARFADGIYLVWYPQVTQGRGGRAAAPAAGARARRLAERAADRPAARLAGLRPGRQRRLRAQPAAHLHAQLERRLPCLVDVLGQYDGAHFLIERLAD